MKRTQTRSVGVKTPAEEETLAEIKCTKKRPAPIRGRHAWEGPQRAALALRQTPQRPTDIAQVDEPAHGEVHGAQGAW